MQKKREKKKNRHIYNHGYLGTPTTGNAKPHTFYYMLTVVQLRVRCFVAKGEGDASVRDI